MSSKVLNKFPKKTGNKFDVGSYYHDVRLEVGAPSEHTGLFGVEVELEGTGLPGGLLGTAVIDGATWVPHVDNSLRNGVEYVFSKPVDKTHAVAMVRDLFEYLRAAGAEVRNSYRCSTHVHVNMRGVKVNEMAAFVGLWGMFENVLANWCGPTRSGNLFALRLSDTEVAVDNWVRGFKNGDFNFSNNQRYLALNPACLRRFGSLEVRTMRGISSAAELEPWLDALDRLRTYSKQYRDPSDIVMDFSAFGPLGMFERILGDLPIFAEALEATVQAGDDAEELIRGGFRRIQPILYSLPWSEVLTEIEKVYIPDPFGVVPKVKPRRGGENHLADFAEAIAPAPARAFRLDAALDEEDE